MVLPFAFFKAISTNLIASISYRNFFPLNISKTGRRRQKQVLKSFKKLFLVIRFRTRKQKRATLRQPSKSVKNHPTFNLC